MNTDIKNIIDKQIGLQTKTPDASDLVDYSALFEYTDSELKITPHETCSVLKARLQAVGQLFSNFREPNVKFIMHLHDHAGDSQDHSNYGLCFGKKRHQQFITIPNLYLLSGRLDHVLSEVKDDKDLFDKHFMSIFAGGANCGPDGVRLRYLMSHPNPVFHHIVVSNHSIMSINDQLNYTFNLTIDGHSACYDRLYWQMASNSVPVYIEKNKDIVQLHDEIIYPDEHYMEATVEGWPETFNLLRQGCEDPRAEKDIVSYMKNIVNNGKDFISNHFGDNAANTSADIVKYILSELRHKQS